MHPAKLVEQGMQPWGLSPFPPSFMASLFKAQPLAVFPRLPRRIFCVLSISFLFATFFVIYLPPAYVPRFFDALHFPAQHPSSSTRPLLLTLPSSGSHRHRINAQPPLTEHGKGDIWAQRADAVRNAFLHAINGYVAYAAPHDELRPLSKAPVDKCVLSVYRRALGPLT